MVERYPVYKPKVGIASLPSVDFTQLKEEAKNYSSLANAMSKMSSFFAKEAGDAAAIEGAEYGAANPVTKEQIEAANVSGVELEILDDDYTIYGKAAREAAIISGSNNMEAQAKRSFVEIVTAGIQNGTPSGEIQKQLDAVTFGFVDSLMEASPIAAQKLNATLSVSASSAWQSYVNDEITQNAKKQKAHLNFLVDNFIDEQLPNLVASGYNIEGGMDTAYKLIKENVMNKTIALRGASDTFTQAQSDNLDKAYLLQRQNAISKWLDEDDMTKSTKLNQLLEDNINDPRIADIYRSLDENEKNGLAVIIRDNQKNNYETKIILEEIADKEDLKIAKTLQNDFYKALIIDKDDKAAKEILAKIDKHDRNGEIYDTLLKAYNKREDDVQSDISTLDSFETQLTGGRLTVIDVAGARADGLINFKDYEKYLGKVLASNDKNVQRALKYAKNELNIDDTFVLYTRTGGKDLSKERQTYNAIQNRLTDEYIAFQSMPLADRMNSPLTDNKGNFDALTYIVANIDKLVKGKSIAIDKQKFVEIETMISSFKTGRVDHDWEQYSDKTVWADFTVKDIQNILASIANSKPKGMDANIWNNKKTILNQMIKGFNNGR